MKKSYQGHLHPKLQVPGLRFLWQEIELGLFGGRRELYRKELMEQLVYSYLEHPHMSALLVENAWDIARPVHVLHEHT